MSSQTIRFEATFRKVKGRTILQLPESASTKLPSRGQVGVRGTINGPGPDVRNVDEQRPAERPVQTRQRRPDELYCRPGVRERIRDRTARKATVMARPSRRDGALAVQRESQHL